MVVWVTSASWQCLCSGHKCDITNWTSHHGFHLWCYCFGSHRAPFVSDTFWVKGHKGHSNCQLLFWRHICLFAFFLLNVSLKRMSVTVVVCATTKHRHKSTETICCRFWWQCNWIISSGKRMHVHTKTITLNKTAIPFTRSRVAPTFSLSFFVSGCSHWNHLLFFICYYLTVCCWLVVYRCW